jgi:hypothetical protein
MKADVRRSKKPEVKICVDQRKSAAKVFFTFGDFGTCVSRIALIDDTMAENRALPDTHDLYPLVCPTRRHRIPPFRDL